MSGLYVPEVDDDADTLTAALAYAAAGLYVGPCSNATKHPGSILGKGWQEQTSTDAGQIVAWFAGSSHGLFLHVGRSGLLVLDVDDYGALPDWVDALITEHSPPFQSTRADDSRRGHYVFSQPADRMIGNGTGELGKGWGEVRGKNGVVIVQPTAHEKADQGARYLWVRTGAVPYSAELAAALPDAADKVKPTELAQPVERDDQDEATRRRVDTWTAAALAGECQALRDMAAWPDGYRDERGRGWEKCTADAAHRLGALARATWNGLTTDQARQAFTGAAPTCSTFTAHHVAEKWDQQSCRGEPATWPASLDTPPDTSGVTFMASQPLPSATGDEQPVYREPGALTDAHLADRVAHDVLVGRFCWTAALGWLRWDGRRWQQTPEVAVVDAVRLYFIEQHASAARRGAGTEVLQALSRLLARTRIVAVVALTRGVVLADAAAFDQRPDLLNVGNGVVDLRTGALLPHDPALWLTRVTEVAYDPEATSPDWDEALTSLPEDVRPYLQVRMGQAATGHTPPDDVMPVLQGGGSNGKTALTGAVQRALGEHAALVSDRLLQASPDAHPTELMDLRGARFALIEETPEARRLSVARLKKAVGTPEITARLMRCDDVTFRATHGLFLTSNYRPQVEETDDGTWRRLQLVRFPFRYRLPGDPLTSDTDRRGDSGLKDRLLHGEAQQRAVLRWLVDGARAWYEADRVMPTAPERVKADTFAWRAEADHVLGYLTERLVFDRGRHVTGTDLLADFNAWAESRGLRAWGNQTLAERFGAHSSVTAADVQQRRLSSGPGLSRPPATFLGAAVPTRFRGWAGVRFRTDADDAAEALQAPVDGVDGVLHKSPSHPPQGIHRTPPSTPSTDLGDGTDGPF